METKHPAAAYRSLVLPISCWSLAGNYQLTEDTDIQTLNTAGSILDRIFAVNWFSPRFWKICHMLTAKDISLRLLNCCANFGNSTLSAWLRVRNTSLVDLDLDNNLAFRLLDLNNWAVLNCGERGSVPSSNQGACCCKSCCGQDVVTRLPKELNAICQSYLCCPPICRVPHELAMSYHMLEECSIVDIEVEGVTKTQLNTLLARNGMRIQKRHWFNRYLSDELLSMLKRVSPEFYTKSSDDFAVTFLGNDRDGRFAQDVRLPNPVTIVDGKESIVVVDLKDCRVFNHSRIGFSDIGYAALCALPKLDIWRAGGDYVVEINYQMNHDGHGGLKISPLDTGIVYPHPACFIGSIVQYDFAYQVP